MRLEKFDFVEMKYGTCYRSVYLENKSTYQVYCMKMIKNILFEVLPITSYTFFPPVWQLVDATPRKLSLF